MQPIAWHLKALQRRAEQGMEEEKSREGWAEHGRLHRKVEQRNNRQNHRAERSRQFGWGLGDLVRAFQEGVGGKTGLSVAPPAQLSHL